ncbi:MAG: hypothetical protein HUU16_10415, partial [Candidatus Omnitrophica bacterium]|nr:hypothetical protein [Candidatus Omnitrophota bacterium]
MSGPLSVPDFDAPRSARRGGDARRLTLGHAAVFLGALALITLASLPPRPNPERLLDMRVGEAATRSVLAPFPLKVLDVEKTELRRKEAADKTPPTYRPRPEAAMRARLKWETLVALVEDEKVLPVTDEAIIHEARAFLASLTDADQKLLKRKLADGNWRGSVLSRFTRALEEKEIVAIDPQEQTEAPANGAPVLWRLREPDGSLQDRVSWVSVESVTQQAEVLGRTLLEFDFGADEKAKPLAMSLAAAFIEPNLEFDAVATEADRLIARASVPSVSIEFKQNQRLVARGELVTEDQKRALAELSARMQSRLGDVLGRMLLIAVMLGVIFVYLRRNHAVIYHNLPRLAAFLGQITLVAWSGLVVAWGVEFNAFQGSEESVGMVGLVVPVASAGIMISLLENSRLALFSVIMSSFLVGIQFNWGFEILLTLALTGILAVFQLAGISRRSQVYWVIPWI